MDDDTELLVRAFVRERPPQRRHRGNRRRCTRSRTTASIQWARAQRRSCSVFIRLPPIAHCTRLQYRRLARVESASVDGRPLVGT
jgi:hypothetical protein